MFKNKKSREQLATTDLSPEQALSAFEMAQTNAAKTVRAAAFIISAADDFFGDLESAEIDDVTQKEITRLIENLGQGKIKKLAIGLGFKADENKEGVTAYLVERIKRAIIARKSVKSLAA